MVDIVTCRRLLRRGRANALRLDALAACAVDAAASARRAGKRALMRFYALSATERARLVAHRFAHLPPAA